MGSVGGGGAGFATYCHRHIFSEANQLFIAKEFLIFLRRLGVQPFARHSTAQLKVSYMTPAGKLTLFMQLKRFGINEGGGVLGPVLALRYLTASWEFKTVTLHIFQHG